MQVTDPVTLAMLQLASKQRDQYANEMILMAGDIAEANVRIKQLEDELAALKSASHG